MSDEYKAGFITKDSGERTQFSSGMVRDSATGKKRFDLAFDGPLVWSLWDGTKHQGLVRCAENFYLYGGIEKASAVVMELAKLEGGLRPLLGRYTDLLTRGAAKYTEHNWMLAEGDAELKRFKISFCRHLEQYLFGDIDEDHAPAVMFNMNGAEYVSLKMRQDIGGILHTEAKLAEGKYTADYFKGHTKSCDPDCTLCL